ncbi:MAG: hypothetical protein FJW40_13480 [Acidobacteria bacterium]|nr:hypothetical protein [Acidobacteriota bacterium]
MHRLLALAVLGAASFFGAPDLNVNSRYLVESAELNRGKRPESRHSAEILRSLAGSRVTAEAIAEVERRLRREYPCCTVRHEMERGSRPEHVRITFHLETRRETAFDRDGTRLIYHSKQNWSWRLDADFDPGRHHILAGVVTDNNSLMERYSGVRGGYFADFLDGRMSAGFEGHSYRSQWNPAVLSRVHDRLGYYRERRGIGPQMQFLPAPGLRVQAGLSFESIDFQFPAAARLSSHVAYTTLRFVRTWERGSFQHRLNAGYNLRAATRSLSSDLAYSRHFADARYRLRQGRQSLILTGQAGRLTGDAPLYERFVLGNTTTLRGWNKYDVAPLGGNRVVHGGVEYRTHGVRFLYDIGANWQAGVAHRKARHSLGAGFIKGGTTVVLAFPLRAGNVSPVLFMGWEF